MTRGRRPKSKIIKKQDVIRIAHQLFSQHGIKAVSIDAIAAKAKISKVTLYKLISPAKTKEGLVLEALAYEKEQELSLLKDIPEIKNEFRVVTWLKKIEEKQKADKSSWLRLKAEREYPPKHAIHKAASKLGFEIERRLKQLSKDDNFEDDEFREGISLMIADAASDRNSWALALDALERFCHTYSNRR